MPGERKGNMDKEVTREEAVEKAKTFIQTRYGWKPEKDEGVLVVGEEWEVAFKTKRDSYCRVLVPFDGSDPCDDTDELDPFNEEDLATGEEREEE